MRMLLPTDYIRWAFGGVFPTPHCRFCFHERADEEHVIWHCPRFSRVRQEWPEVLQQSSHWPNCARHAMIFTSCMDQTLKPQWTSFQKLVAELLYQWMEMNRNSELCHLLPFDAAGDSEALPVQQNDILTSKQKSLSATSSLLPLTWDPPVCRTAINKWGASMQDFYLIFSFWHVFQSKSSLCIHHPDLVTCSCDLCSGRRM